MTDQHTFRFYGGPHDGQAFQLVLLGEGATETVAMLPRFIDVEGHPNHRYEIQLDCRAYSWRSREAATESR